MGEQILPFNLPIKLTAEDVSYAMRVGLSRYKVSRGLGITDRACSSNPDKVGSLGEVAFGKLIGQSRNVSQSSGSDGGIDFTVNGWNIDVKSVSGPQHRFLILTNQGPNRNGSSWDIHESTDVWVMMRPADDSYSSWNAVGWCNRQDALSSGNIFLGVGSSQPLGIHYNSLRPMRDLAALLKSNNPRKATPAVDPRVTPPEKLAEVEERILRSRAELMAIIDEVENGNR